jgi:hypothetical protein
MYEKCRLATKDKEVLVLSDTTEFNLESHRGRIKDFTGLGSTSLNAILGFFAQAGLCIDENSGYKLGWAHLNLFNRAVHNKPFIRENYSVAIEEKESYKWIKACIDSKSTSLLEAKNITYVMDREADIYEAMERIKKQDRCDFIIRAKHNRKVQDETGQRVKLIDDITNAESSLMVEVSINGESRKRKKRTVICDLKYKSYSVPITHSVLKKETYDRQININVVQIKERSTPKEEQPLVWTLLTSREIRNKEQAIKIVDNYKRRWDVEEAFRLLKKKGFNIEATELESGTKIRKLLLLAMEASIKVMQLKAARDGDTLHTTNEVFTKDEIDCLALLNQQLQGNTEKLSNPHPKQNLGWAAWIISRLGGWDGYKSQRPPGTITIKRGVDIFNQKAEMFSLIKNSS